MGCSVNSGRIAYVLRDLEMINETQLLVCDIDCCTLRALVLRVHFIYLLTYLIRYTVCMACDSCTGRHLSYSHF